MILEVVYVEGVPCSKLLFDVEERVSAVVSEEESDSRLFGNVILGMALGNGKEGRKLEWVSRKSWSLFLIFSASFLPSIMLECLLVILFKL